MPVSHCHAASTATRISTCQARMRRRSVGMLADSPFTSSGPSAAGAQTWPPHSPGRPTARCGWPSWRGRPEFFAEGVPDLAVLAGVLVGLAEMDDVARARQLHVVDLLDAPRPP